MLIFGAKSRAMRGCALKLACGRRIGLADCTVFTEIFGEFAAAQRADVDIGPYKAQKTAHPSTSIRQIFTALQFTNAEIVMPARRAFGLRTV